MVNIILVSNTILQMHIVVDGCKNILFCNMFWNQESHIFTDCFILLFFSLVFLQNFRQFRIVNFFCDSQRFFICFWQERIEIYHHIGENFLISSFFRLNKYIWNSCILNFISQFLCYKSSSLCNHLSCHRTDSIFCQFKTGNSVTKSQFFVKLISSYFSQIVASHIKEHTVDEIFRTVYCQRLARTQFLVKFQQTILIVLWRILGKTCQNFRFLSEHIQNLLVRSYSQGTKQHRDRNFSISIYTDIKYIIGVGLIL